MTSPHDTLLRLFAPEGRANPYPLYGTLLSQAPVLTVGRGRVVVTGYQGCVDVLRDTKLYPVPDSGYADRFWPDWEKRASTALLYRSLLFLNPPDNQPARHLVSRFFNPARIDSLRPTIEHQVRVQVSAFVADGGGDATRSFTTIPNAVLAEMLGIPHDDMVRLAEWLDAFLERNELHPPDKPLEQADEAAPRLAAYVREKLLAGHSRDDAGLAAALVASGSFDDRDLVSNLVFVLGAGTVTTSSLLGSALLRLAENGGLLPRLRTDDALLRSFVLEVLRHDPPIQYAARVAAADTELCGVPIARDCLVLVCLGAAGRDPVRFARPEEFVADRFVAPGTEARAMLSFGLGTHRCAGAELAMVTAETAVRCLAHGADTVTVVRPPLRWQRAVVRKFTRLDVRVSCS